VYRGFITIHTPVDSEDCFPRRAKIRA
jgi:hypothetical protein